MKAKYTSNTPPETAIFQIMLWKQSHIQEGWLDVMCLGTGFFISKYGVFLTAKHVLDTEIEDSDGKLRNVLDFQQGKGLMAAILLKETVYPFAISNVVFHPTADIALGIARPPLVDNRQIPGVGISLCTIDSQEATPGTKILAFGFQRTMLKISEDDTISVNFQPRYYDGHVKQHYPNGFLLPKWPVYHTSVPLPSGISGCPVINFQRKAVIGISCTSLSGHPDEDVEESTITDIRQAFSMEVPPKLAGFKGKTLYDLITSEGLLI